MSGTMKRMVRKQLNIAPQQDEALKRLSAERGVSESELVRDAIDALLAHANAEADRAHRPDLLENLFGEWDAHPVVVGSSLEAYRFGVYDGE